MQHTPLLLFIAPHDSCHSCLLQIILEHPALEKETVGWDDPAWAVFMVRCCLALGSLTLAFAWAQTHICYPMWTVISMHNCVPWAVSSFGLIGLGKLSCALQWLFILLDNVLFACHCPGMCSNALLSGHVML